MFFLSEIEHTLRLPPYLLSQPLNVAIKGELDSIFLDRVIEKLGLCVCVYDIQSYVHVTLGFFDDIYVPVPLLATPNHFEYVQGYKDSVTWFWEYDGQNYPIDGADEIRFKVHNVSYPSIPLDHERDSDQNDVMAVKPFAPMVITGSLDGDGLGPVAWW